MFNYHIIQTGVLRTKTKHTETQIQRLLDLNLLQNRSVMFILITGVTLRHVYYISAVKCDFQSDQVQLNTTIKWTE